MLPKFLENLSPDIYHSDNYVVLDFETDTSHGDYGNAVHADNGIVLASWKHASGKVVSKWGSEFEMQELVSDIQEADFLVAHNAKYELMWLERCGLDLSDTVVFCTQLAEYVLTGNRSAPDDATGLRPLSLSLDMCCRRRGWKIKDPVVDVMIKDGINPVRIPRPWLQGRCEQDVETTEQLFKDQLVRLTDSSRLPVLYTRCLLTPVLSAVEFEGMCLNPDRVKEEYEEYTLKQNQLQQDMDQLTGGINWRSPNQVAEFIYDKLGFQEKRNRKGEPLRNAANKAWPNGLPKTDQDTLAALKATTKDQKHFLSLRKDLGKVSAALSKNLEFFRGVVSEMKGVFKANFHQSRTATHRLSSSGIPTYFEQFGKEKTVQFQNLPRVFKRLFRAKQEGWLMGEADGSQLEFRVAADLGKCESAKELIVTGGDVHELSTKVQFGHSTEELAELAASNPKKFKQQRTDSKSWTFQPLYGGEGKTKKQKDYAKAFREAYPGIAEEQKRWVDEVRDTKMLVTPWGLRYYWPKAKPRRDGTLNVKNSVYNYPVQAYATAEIIPIAVFCFWHRVKEEGLDDRIILVNTVHDSIIVELHPAHVDDFRRIAKLAFCADVYSYLSRVYGIDFDFVPLGVGITVGEHWTEGEEEAYNIYYDGTEERVE